MASYHNIRRSRRRSQKQMASINVTPFVDVMLVLLVVFMLTAPLLTVGVHVDLPKTKAGNISGNDEPLVISYTHEEKIFLQETEVAWDKLTPRIQAISNNNKDLRIFIRADENLAYGRVMELMGNLASEGFTRVSLISQNKK